MCKAICPSFFKGGINIIVYKINKMLDRIVIILLRLHVINNEVRWLRNQHFFDYIWQKEKKKLLKRECPGCEQLFSSYFEIHESKFRCVLTCSTSKEERWTAEGVREDNADSSPDIIESHKVTNIFTKFSRKNTPSRKRRMLSQTGILKSGRI